MSIRLRLALWYGGLFALVLLLVTLLSNVFHVRSHYDDRDQALISSAGHAVAEATVTGGKPYLLKGSGGLEVGLRLYGPDGALREGTPGADALPPLDPRAVLAAPSGSPYDALTQLVAPRVAPNLPAGGAFGLLIADGQRWRVFVQPLRAGVASVGYIVALAPLKQLDASVQTYQVLLVGLGLAGLTGALLGSWVIAGKALAPIARMIQTGATIARSRDLTRRIEAPPHRDELGQLAATFNAMLAGVEAAGRAQQRLVADASHELRAPLTAIQGNLELLRRHPDMPPGDHAEALTEVEREATRMACLVAELLTLARADAGMALPRRPVDLDAVVLDLFQAARRLARGQRLRLEPFEPVRVTGDEDRLRQLVRILLDNALKYTPDAGSVTLGLRSCGAEAEIFVRDTGIGIPAADLPHVFERFYRADAARGRDPGGSGLGLPIACWIAQQYGGDVSIISAPGQGTTATVRLPVLAAASDAACVLPR